MITEDYVSFETAKLLKEKGFEGYSIITTYDKGAADAYIKELQEKHLPYCSGDPKFKEFYYTKPALQIAMKWLREIHKIHIQIWILEEEGYWFNIEKILNTQYKHKSLYSSSLEDVYFETYEEACEAAIKYCLENFI